MRLSYRRFLCKHDEWDGQVLYYASQKLRDDKDVVLAAVTNKAIILKYASQRLRADKDIALAAVKQNKKSFSYIADELKNDEDIQNIINPPQEG